MSSAVSSKAPAPVARERALRPLSMLALLLLAVQFLLGMVVNLFVPVPASHPGTNAPEYFSGVAAGVAWTLAHGDWWLRLHAVDGLLLFLDGLVLIWLAVASRRRAWIVASVLGCIGTIAAGFNGASFLNYGHNFSSLLMSIGFFVATVSYAVGVYITR